ncbi:hypothetical protein PRIEUP_LOCUS1899, partial [Pristimantis euphronides]
SAHPRRPLRQRNEPQAASAASLEALRRRVEEVQPPRGRRYQSPRRTWRTHRTSGRAARSENYTGWRSQRLQRGKRRLPHEVLPQLTSQEHEQALLHSMKGGGGEQSPSWRSESPQHSPASDNGHTPRSPHSPAYSGEDDTWDWQAQLKALPTKIEVDSLLLRMEKSHKSDISGLREEMQHIGNRVMGVEEMQEQILQQLAAHKAVILKQAAQISDMSTHLDDLDNRNGRNNIRIRGLSEEVGNQQLEEWALKFFSDLLNRPRDQPILIDRIYRAWIPPNNLNPDRPCDVVCRIHFFKDKEATLRASWSARQDPNQDCSVFVLPDIAKKTLALRKALKPLLMELKTRDISYRWGYPFQLSARKERKTTLFRNIKDLPGFLKILNLPQIPLPEWPTTVDLPELPQKGNWSPAGSRHQR